MAWSILPPSPLWQWVGLIVGFIALFGVLMSLPTILQMIWGRPKVTIDVNVKEMDGARVLECRIFNYPIVRGILKLLCVRRMAAEDIVASFSIEECGSGRVVFPGAVPYIITYTDTKSQRVGLPASPFPAAFGIVIVMYDTGEVKPFGEDTTILLAPGKYSARIDITVEGKRIVEEQEFVVCETRPFAYWTADS